MRTVRRIAEEEYILVVLLAGFGLIFLLIFPPAIFVNDSWLNLMAGREVIENGLPSHDELTVYGFGNTWTDQQWLAQVFMYGIYSLGGHALLSIVTAALVVAAFSIAAAASRSLGAGPRAIWVLFLPVLMAAPWAWSVRAQMLALALYTGLLWLLAPLAVLATPYGPVETARYYHLLLVDPPFAGRVTEWHWAEPAVNTMFFY